MVVIVGFRLAGVKDYDARGNIKTALDGMQGRDIYNRRGAEDAEIRREDSLSWVRFRSVLFTGDFIPFGLNECIDIGQHTLHGPPNAPGRSSRGGIRQTQNHQMLRLLEGDRPQQGLNGAVAANGFDCLITWMVSSNGIE